MSVSANGECNNQALHTPPHKYIPRNPNYHFKNSQRWPIGLSSPSNGHRRKLPLLKWPQSFPFPILAISEALTDEQWESDLTGADLEAEFNQISAVNTQVQPFSWILAFLLCSSVVDQSCSALSINAGLSGPHLAEWLPVLPIQGCSAGSSHWPGWELLSQSKKKKRRTASAPLFSCSGMHTHTNTQIHPQPLPNIHKETHFPLS